MKREQRDYDKKRTEDTLRKLKIGFDELKSADPQKPITKYALSKHTGVAKQTIEKFPEITNLLAQEKGENVDATLDAEKRIKSLEKQLRDQGKENDKLLKATTTLNLKIVELEDENRRLKSIIERYENNHGK